MNFIVPKTVLMSTISTTQILTSIAILFVVIVAYLFFVDLVLDKQQKQYSSKEIKEKVVELEALFLKNGKVSLNGLNNNHLKNKKHFKENKVATSIQHIGLIILYYAILAPYGFKMYTNGNYTMTILIILLLLYVSVSILKDSFLKYGKRIDKISIDKDYIDFVLLDEIFESKNSENSETKQNIEEVTIVTSNNFNKSSRDFKVYNIQIIKNDNIYEEFEILLRENSQLDFKAFLVMCNLISQNKTTLELTGIEFEEFLTGNKVIS